jgi:hypothetical protein
MSYTNGLDDPTLYFNTVLYTGTGSTSNSVTGVGFQPDWLWLKSRSNAYPHFIYDVVRTNRSALFTNNTNAEDTGASNQMTSFDSDGFTVVDSGGSVGTNASGSTFVAWNWLAGGTASSNTDGSITSSVSANTTAGFSIVSYTGTGANATVGHGLGSAPKMMIVKNRDDVENWEVYHESLGNGNAIRLNLSDASFSTSGRWNNTSPTSSVFSLGTANAVNGSGDDMIAYCFADTGNKFFKAGSYTGNGNADGTFVYTGFKPAWIMAKKSNSTGNWVIVDTKRDGYNGANDTLQANVTDVESGGNRFDIVSNGFKARSTSAYSNSSGDTFIYMAFASNPFVTSTGIPTVAR